MSHIQMFYSLAFLTQVSHTQMPHTQMPHTQKSHTSMSHTQRFSDRMRGSEASTGIMRLTNATRWEVTGDLGRIKY
jgi:uncharacterized protein involved in copper resistance